MWSGVIYIQLFPYSVPGIRRYAVTDTLLSYYNDRSIMLGKRYQSAQVVLHFLKPDVSKFR